MDDLTQVLLVPGGRLQHWTREGFDPFAAHTLGEWLVELAKHRHRYAVVDVKNPRFAYHAMEDLELGFAIVPGVPSCEIEDAYPFDYYTETAQAWFWADENGALGNEQESKFLAWAEATPSCWNQGAVVNANWDGHGPYEVTSRFIDIKGGSDLELGNILHALEGVVDHCYTVDLK